MKNADPVGWPWLRTPEATRLINRLWPDDEQELEKIRQRAINDEIFTRAIRSCWQKADGK